ncbi:fimbria/pilus periplasmic chaperone [Aeromonas hydrophila]
MSKNNHPMAWPLLLLALTGTSQAAVSLDRTRIIFPGGSDSLSVHIQNNNKEQPYLAQAWLEDTDGKKISGPFTVLPPLQRLEPGAESMVKLQALPGVSLLPQDKESLFYFNLREVPPRSKTPNSLQLALQSTVKFFYRPAALVVKPGSQSQPWQEQLQLQRQGDHYQLNNPTPYYITVVEAASAPDKPVLQFKPVMVAPNSQLALGVTVAQLGGAPRLTYINDYGGNQPLNYRCSDSCVLQQGKE